MEQREFREQKEQRGGANGSLTISNVQHSHFTSGRVRTLVDPEIRRLCFRRYYQPSSFVYLLHSEWIKIQHPAPHQLCPIVDTSSAVHVIANRS